MDLSIGGIVLKAPNLPRGDGTEPVDSTHKEHWKNTDPRRFLSDPEDRTSHPRSESVLFSVIHRSVASVQLRSDHARTVTTDESEAYLLLFLDLCCH